MNVDNQGVGRDIGAAVWEHPEMRTSLAMRDLAAVYRRLQRSGVSQRRIAALTGQSPSEVYEILNGRQVMAYDVLARIADGLGVPRGYLGLAYDESTSMAMEAVTAVCSADAGEREEVRRLLAHAAEVTIGAAVNDVSRWWQPVERDTTPVPTRVGIPDVVHIEGTTAVMRVLDYRHGGGACRDAVVAQVKWAQQLLQARYDQQVGRRLHQAVADLHNLAGWTSFDVGLYSAARRHFGRALAQAKQAGDPSLVANVLYRMGRLHIHRGMCREALRFFQLGQIAAQDAGCELTVSMLCANEGWALALAGENTHALKSISRAQDEFARTDLLTAPVWVRFFGIADLHALTGMVHVAMSNPDRAQLDTAITELNLSLAGRRDDMTRSRIFELTALATAYFRAGDSSVAVKTGHQAADLAGKVRSVRTIDRLEPLQVEAEERQDRDEDVKALASRIARIRAG